jgi:hypothetical protein
VNGPIPGAVDQLLEDLRDYRGAQVFNQYGEVNLEYDRPDAAERRRANMRAYLDIFRDAAYVAVAEAPGYNGARFSGVWFTAERLLVGEQALPWASASGRFVRCSRDDRPLRPELSSTIVWSALGERRDIIFWPSFPWHPIGARGPMSNRAPRRDESRVGLEVLRFFLDAVVPGRIPFAIGRHGQAALEQLGYNDVLYVRHPSQGGAAEFRRGIAALPRRDL